MLTLLTDAQITDLAIALKGQEYRRFYINLAQKYYGGTVERIDVTVCAHWNDDGYSMGIGTDEETEGIRVFDDTGNELVIDIPDVYYRMLEEARDKLPATPRLVNDEYTNVTTTFYVSDVFKRKRFDGSSAEGLELYSTYTMPDHVRQQHDMTLPGGVQYQTFVSGPAHIVNAIIAPLWENRHATFVALTKQIAAADNDI